MAVVNLPDSPANGTTQTVGGITYTYNSSKGYWTAAASSGGGGGGGASVSTSDAAPGSPSDGDLWYDTDDGGMFVYYQDTDSSQWVEVIGSQGAPGPAGAAGATTAGVASVYATVDALPTSGNTQGDMAHVTANNTLYFWNGSGWYKIALINTNPSISGVASAYALAIDGTATTVTMTATDPEGLPITYSIASDTSGNIASVSQGTGASTNVFTITPSTNTAYAGSFTLTFRASDGVNVATAPATFTLQFTVSNSRYTSSLITSVGANNAVNNSFDDKSTSNHTITTGGDATQTTFSPYRHGGYSTKFVGTEYLKTNSSISIANDFTMEFWIYRTASGNDYMVCVGNTSSTAGMEVYIGSSGGQFNFYHNGASRIYSTSSIPALNEWSHIAVVRNSGTVTMYLNGTSLGTYSMTDTISGEVYVNAELYNSSVTSAGDGYMRDVRIVDGTAIYTSNFTPPTEKLTEVSGTEVLLCNLPYIADSSSNSLALTITGTPETQPFTPFDAQEYSASSHLGSASLDGTGDFLSVADHADFEFGSGDFTMEAWIYLTGYSNSYGGYYAGGIMGKDSSGNRSFTFSVQATSNSYTGLQLYLFNGGTATSTIGSASMGLNQWYHVAATRASGTVKLFLNGKQIQSGTNSTNIDNLSAPFVVGASSSFSNYEYRLKGNISDARVVKGTAVYTSNFTPPTAPLTAITNTKLLVQSTDAGIIDKSQSVQNVKLYGNTKSSTTQTKYLTSSMYFDGNGDYITLSNSTDRLGWLANLSSVGTIEAWIYPTTLRNGTNVFQNPGILTLGDTYFTLNVNSSGQLVFYWYNGSLNSFTSSAAISVNTWHHVAAVITATSGSNNVTLYVDGTSVGTGTYTGTGGQTAAALAQSTLIGFGNSSDGASYWPGYISDLRITEGLARYTSNFTPPAAALQG